MNWTTIAIELGIIIGLATILCGLMFAVTIPYVASIQAKSVLSIAAIIMVTLIYFSVQLDWISNPFVAIGMVLLCVVTGGVTSLIDEKKQKRTVMIEDESWHAEG